MIVERFGEGLFFWQECLAGPCGADAAAAAAAASTAASAAAALLTYTRRPIPGGCDSLTLGHAHAPLPPQQTNTHKTLARKSSDVWRTLSLTLSHTHTRAF